MPEFLGHSPDCKKSQSRMTQACKIAAIPVVAMIAATTPLTARNAKAPVLDPTQIDRAVSAFTGAGIGKIGGARAPADRRLRLAACAQPLTTSWHGTTRAAVKVECRQTHANEGPWRIFVATRPNTRGGLSSKHPTRDALTAPIIKRGDPITVLVRGRGFSVQQTGEAMENGSAGDWIGVRTARQADPIRARIERPGLAVIPVG